MPSVSSKVTIIIIISMYETYCEMANMANVFLPNAMSAFLEMEPGKNK
jgi:hypothetical protein